MVKVVFFWIAIVANVGVIFLLLQVIAMHSCPRPRQFYGTYLRLLC